MQLLSQFPLPIPTISWNRVVLSPSGGMRTATLSSCSCFGLKRLHLLVKIVCADDYIKSFPKLFVYNHRVRDGRENEIILPAQSVDKNIVQMGLVAFTTNMGSPELAFATAPAVLAHANALV